MMMGGPDPGHLTGPTHPLQAAAAKQAEAARLAAEAKKATEAKEKVRLLGVVLVHVSRISRRLPVRGGLMPLCRIAGRWCKVKARRGSVWVRLATSRGRGLIFTCSAATLKAVISFPAAAAAKVRAEHE